MAGMVAGAGVVAAKVAVSGVGMASMTEVALAPVVAIDGRVVGAACGGAVSVGRLGGRVALERAVFVGGGTVSVGSVTAVDVAGWDSSKGEPALLWSAIRELAGVSYPPVRRCRLEASTHTALPN